MNGEQRSFTENEVFSVYLFIREKSVVFFIAEKSRRRKERDGVGLIRELINSKAFLVL